LNISGSSDSGSGVVVSNGANVNTTGDSGLTDINGTSNAGNGTDLNPGSNVTTTGNGTTDITGNSTSGAGVEANGNTTTNNGTLNICGSSDSGSGVVVSNGANINTSGDSGATNINGTSDTGNGVDLNPGSNVTTTGNGSTNVTGSSTTGTGVDANGNTTTTGNGRLNISGNSTSGTGVEVTTGGYINTAGNGSTNISGNGSSGVIVDVPNQTSTTNNGKLTICSNGVCSVFQQEAATTSDTARSYNSLKYIWGAGVIGSMLWAALDNEWYLNNPDMLTIDSGDAAYWADGKMEYVILRPHTDKAEAQLLTHEGVLKRELTLRDSTDGVRHYVWQDGSGARAVLSVNVHTREYFYEETGSAAGGPYKVEAHGWLTPSPLAPRSLKE
jgi:hypothetical protein